MIPELLELVDAWRTKADKWLPPNDYAAGQTLQLRMCANELEAWAKRREAGERGLWELLEEYEESVSKRNEFHREMHERIVAMGRELKSSIRKLTEKEAPNVRP